MQRISKQLLQNKVDTLNRMTGNPVEPYRKEGEKWIANVGNYHLSGAYGGFSLHRMGNESGGISDIFSCGHIEKRQLANLIDAYMAGIYTAHKEQTA